MSQVGYIKECKCKADFRHKDGAGKEVDCVNLDHYIAGCPDVIKHNKPVPLVLAYALYGALTAVRYGERKPVVSVTMLSRCPLTTYFETHTPWVGKVLDVAFMLRGTYAHEGMLAELKGKPGWQIEVPRSVTIDGVKVYGTPDAYYENIAHLYDLKTQQEYAVERKLKATDAQLYADPFVKDNVGQLNCYAVMLREAGFKVSKAELLYMDGKWKNTTGKSRVRVLPVPLADHDATVEWMRPRAALMQQVLDKTIPLGEIPAKEYTGWKPKSGVDYLVTEQLEQEVAA
jgi:hypothetical protein